MPTISVTVHSRALNLHFLGVLRVAESSADVHFTFWRSRDIEIQDGAFWSSKNAAKSYSINWDVLNEKIRAYEEFQGFLNHLNDNHVQFRGLVNEEIQDGALWSLAEMPPISITRLKLNCIRVNFTSKGFWGYLIVMLMSVFYFRGHVTLKSKMAPFDLSKMPPINIAYSEFHYFGKYLLVRGFEGFWIHFMITIFNFQGKLMKKSKMAPFDL